MSDAPEISFVVNAYNTEVYIGDCLRSILAQEDAPSFEIIIIDDCSTDGTQSAVSSIVDERIRYVRHASNQHAAASVTHGISLARGRYIAHIDSDDVYHPCFLKRTFAVLDSQPNVGLVYGNVRYIDETGLPNGGRSDLASRRGGRPLVSRELVPIMFDYYIPAPTILARREAWALSQPIPAGRNFCDWYCSLQMARQWDFAFIDELLADYRLHPGNMHKEMTRQKYGETITWQNLEEMFAAEDFGTETKSLRARVFSTHYCGLGDKYFGFRMMVDARRCYLAAIKHDFALTCQTPGVFRRLLATCLPQGWYRNIKRLFRR